MAEFVLKSTTLNLMAKVNTKYRAQSLGQNLFLHMLAFLWIKQKPSFLKARNLSHWYGFDIRIMFPSFGHMGKKNLRCFSITLLTMTLILNLSVGLTILFSGSRGFLVRMSFDHKLTY